MFLIHGWLKKKEVRIGLPEAGINSNSLVVGLSLFMELINILIRFHRLISYIYLAI